jgi:hypothetical protein
VIAPGHKHRHGTGFQIHIWLTIPPHENIVVNHAPSDDARYDCLGLSGGCRMSSGTTASLSVTPQSVLCTARRAEVSPAASPWRIISANCWKSRGPDGWNHIWRHWFECSRHRLFNVREVCQ